ncbi:uncharacterized protein CIMG_13175 [Coccidioides immitis RS]|uniref:Phosphotransferase enzyme family protein n=1 Tax=Coccidioides immitis (strain RS) TaxID=246410 RepID=J3K625_COCIM|nr:uncharacterized protein CIMG_13175 [Coccidioides immitis RS]EAS29975.3 hypothetical protein CIMG_13175 [Coccidioides immitis RS]
MSRRHVQFNVNELAQVAARPVGANCWTNIKRCADGMFNKAYIFTLDDGRQVVGKVPNSNTRVPHSTATREVATIDFCMRETLKPILIILFEPSISLWKNLMESNSDLFGPQRHHIFGSLYYIDDVDGPFEQPLCVEQPRNSQSSELTLMKNGNFSSKFGRLMIEGEGYAMGHASRAMDSKLRCITHPHNHPCHVKGMIWDILDSGPVQGG